MRGAYVVIFALLGEHPASSPSKSTIAPNTIQHLDQHAPQSPLIAISKSSTTLADIAMPEATASASKPNSSDTSLNSPAPRNDRRPLSCRL